MQMVSRMFWSADKPSIIGRNVILPKNRNYGSTCPLRAETLIFGATARIELELPGNVQDIL